MEYAREKVVEKVTAVLGAAIGSAIGAGIGSVIPGLDTAIGLVVGLVVGALVGAVIGWLKAWWEDDYFPPVNTSISLAGPAAIFGTETKSDIGTLVYSGYGGWYELNGYWELHN